MEKPDYFPLFIVMAIAYLVPIIIKRLRITKVPSVLLEIVCGVLVGPFVFDLLGQQNYLDFLGDVGFLFLIFLSGLETDVVKIFYSLPKGSYTLKKILRNPFFLSLFIYFGSLAIAYPLAYLIHLMFGTDIIFFTILLPTVALSIIVPLIKEDGQINKVFGQITLMVGAIATIASIILISIYSGVLQYGFQEEILLFLFIFVAFGIAYLIGRRIIRIRVFHQIQYLLEHAASQIRVRGSVALMLAFITIASFIRTEPVMGAFFAGMLLSIFIDKDRSALLFKLDGMSYGFFIPIFFIMVGANLDLSALKYLGTTSALVGMILACFFLVQFVPSLATIKLLGRKRSLALGSVLSARLGLAIATSQIALGLGLIDGAINAAIVIAAIFSSILAPIIYRQASGTGKKKYQVFIFGGSKVSGLVGERMKMHSIPSVVVEPNRRRIEDLRFKGIEVISGDLLDREFVTSLSIRPNDRVIVLTGVDRLNVQIAEMLKNEFKIANVSTLLKDESHLVDLSKHGITGVATEKVLADSFEDLVFRPNTQQTLGVNFGEYMVEELEFRNKKLSGKQVKQIPWPPSGSIVLIRRGKEIYIPHGNTHLLEGDIVTVIGDFNAMEEFRDKFE